MKKWKIISDKEPGEIDELIEILLSNRGLTTKKLREEFLNPNLLNVNSESVGLDKKELARSIQRIKKAIKNNEKIIIYGDYDVDGITGTALLWETLYKTYKNVLPYIPHRVDEGYGISEAGINNILLENADVKLIITVDNGIVAEGAINYANERGIDVIVTDHHAKSEKLPKAFSIVHTTNLCGAGVAYMMALEFENVKNPDKVDERLALVALATVADLVPLTMANRALVKYGIEILRITKRIGFLALFSAASIKQQEIDTYHIGHMIAPRLNAAGRIGHAMDALRLICTKDLVKARNLAYLLTSTNQDRQTLTKEATKHADMVLLTADPESKFIIAHDKSYNQGIIGLVASRIVEKHYRPAIVISEGDKYSKGSARSIKGLNIIEFIREHSHLLMDAGGHPMAAGFTIETTKITEFKDTVIAAANKRLTVEMFERILEIDLNLPPNLITIELFESIKKLSPFGMGNPEPVFITKNLKVNNIRLIGKEKEHVKLILSEGKKTFDAIFFKGAEHNIKLEDNIDIVYSLAKDDWNGNNKILLRIKEFSNHQ